jgi:hypothetical protein
VTKLESEQWELIYEFMNSILSDPPPRKDSSSMSWNFILSMRINWIIYEYDAFMLCGDCLVAMGIIASQCVLYLQSYAIIQNGFRKCRPSAWLKVGNWGRWIDEIAFPWFFHPGKWTKLQMVLPFHPTSCLHFLSSSTKTEYQAAFNCKMLGLRNCTCWPLSVFSDILKIEFHSINISNLYIHMI